MFTTGALSSLGAAEAAETERRKNCYAKAHAIIVQAADDAGFKFQTNDDIEAAFIGNLEQQIAAALINSKE